MAEYQKKRAKWVNKLALGVIIAILIAFVPMRSSKSKAQSLLARAGLSPLPQSATNVLYDDWNGFGTGEIYVRFEANARDLQAFISNSPSLYHRGFKPKEVYTTNFHHVQYPASIDNLDVEHNSYFSIRPKFPKWFNPTIPGNGKKYEIDYGPNTDIFIDEDRNIVFLHLVRG